MRQGLDKSTSKIPSALNNRTKNLSQEEIRSLGGAIKYVVSTRSDLSYLDPDIGDIASIIDADGTLVYYNGTAWVAMAHYGTDNIYNYNETVLLGNCASLIVVTHVSDLPDDSENGSLGYVSDTLAYYIKHDTAWVPLTPVKVNSYTDLPSDEKVGTIYYVDDYDSFFIKRDSDWKCLGVIVLDNESSLSSLVGVTGDFAYTVDTDRYYAKRDTVWRDWEYDIEIVDEFPEIPATPKIIWHTGDNQMWASSDTHWVPLMKFTTLTGEVGT